MFAACIVAAVTGAATDGPSGPSWSARSPATIFIVDLPRGPRRKALSWRRIVVAVRCLCHCF